MEMSLMEYESWKLNFREENKNIETRFRMNRVNGQKNIVMKEDRRGKILFRADVTVNMEKKRSKWTPSLAEAIKARAEFESKRIQPEYRNGNEVQKRIRLGNLMKEFIERRTVAPGSAVAMNTRLNTFSHLKDYYTDELTSKMFECCFSANRNGSTTHEYASIIAQLKSLAIAMDFKFSVDTDLLVKRAKRIPGLRRTIYDVSFLTDENLEEFHNGVAKIMKIKRNSRIHNESYQVYVDMLIFSSLTGLRIGEILGLSWESLSSKKVLVERQAYSDVSIIMENNGSYFGPPKHNVIREVTLPSEALKILEKYKKYKSEKFVCESLHLVFPCFRHGRRLNKPIQYQRVDRFLKLIRPFISNDGITIHSFRHTFATRFFNVYGDSPVVMAELAAIMGHSDIATVQKYAKALEANRINKMLNFSYEAPLVSSSVSDLDKINLLMNTRADKALVLTQQGFNPDQVTTILGPMI
ncbi:MAG: tyrosine-type recombinase/integrase [Bacteriovoracaceae bacterium]|nr:tyrosine-type recombinase/integrase [Bacteriovoracaceae bacterium]